MENPTQSLHGEVPQPPLFPVPSPATPSLLCCDPSLSAGAAAGSAVGSKYTPGPPVWGRCLGPSLHEPLCTSWKKQERKDGTFLSSPPQAHPSSDPFASSPSFPPSCLTSPSLQLLDWCCFGKIPLSHPHREPPTSPTPASQEWGSPSLTGGRSHPSLITGFGLPLHSPQLSPWQLLTRGVWVR